MSEQPTSPSDDERRHRRGLKFRKREDHAVELFQEARANLADVDRVNRILCELGRFYNPYANAPVVELEVRKRIVWLLREGDAEAAARLLDERLALYAQGERDP